MVSTGWAKIALTTHPPNSAPYGYFKNRHVSAMQTKESNEITPNINWFEESW